MSCGIYKITNSINKKVYIGCSKNIEHRWIAHKSESILEKYPQYNYTIHKAFRKYGIDNFTFEIIEFCKEDELFEKEKFWIKKYDSFNSGYNDTEGGDSGPSMSGETNPNSKLTENDIIAIRTFLLEGKMLSEIYPLYKDRISKRGFEHIWRGDSWPNILPEAIEYRKSSEYQQKIKSYAGKKSTYNLIKVREEIIDRKEKGEKRLEVYKDFKNIYSISGFNRVWYEYKK